MFAPAPPSAPVVGKADESLFTDADPVLNRNKQATLHIMRELLQCGQWDRAGEWLTDQYIQHNPNAESGLEGVVYFFTQVMKVPRAASCDKLTTEIVAVTAEDDLVTVLWPRNYKDPRRPGKCYSTTWFDTWRFVNAKADEHWDPATDSAAALARALLIFESIPPAAESLVYGVAGCFRRASAVRQREYPDRRAAHDWQIDLRRQHRKRQRVRRAVAHGHRDVLFAVDGIADRCRARHVAQFRMPECFACRVVVGREPAVERAGEHEPPAVASTPVVCGARCRSVHSVLRVVRSIA